MSTVIPPTPGRVVLYRAGKSDQDTAMVQLGSEPLPALVAWVHSDGLVNLAVADHLGTMHARQNVKLVQEGEPVPWLNGDGYCHWMPYQLKVAAGAVEPTLHVADPAITAGAATSQVSAETLQQPERIDAPAEETPKPSAGD